MSCSSVGTKSQPRSFSCFSDILSPAPFDDVYHLDDQKTKNAIPVFQASCYSKCKSSYNTEESHLFNRTSYVTSENYHSLNKNISDKSMVRSTSTLFYDLDKIAKRHSYHSMAEGLASKSIKLKRNSNKTNKTCFVAKSEAIVQECETKIQPKLRVRDSIQTNSKKSKRTSINEPMLSSEIFLNDDGVSQKCNSYAQEQDLRQQKFWSFAKYRTEFTNPTSEKKKARKKDRGKRTEDPCPCQLFSYACPCSDKKSLTELAKSSKTQTLAEQVTNTSKPFLAEDQLLIKNSTQYSKEYDCNEEIQTHSDIKNYSNKYDIIASAGPATQMSLRRETSKGTDKNLDIKDNSQSKTKSKKKIKQVVCPNCNEKLDILSTTEEEILNARSSPNARNNGFTTPTENIIIKNTIQNDIDSCNHDPPCELVPICQILPIDNVYVNTKYKNKYSAHKYNQQKSIKITKGCRHHPPCTVVPSCQRVNVLNNNCEYIPQCLHRPRCVNLPICVPFSKTLNYDDLSRTAEEIDNTEYSHTPRYKYHLGYHRDSLSNSVDNQFRAGQNTCEYVNEYTSRYLMNSDPIKTPTTFSPFILPSPKPCLCCKYDKSCQYDCLDCKCTSSFKHRIKKSTSSDAVIYIRDVGCQFKYKYISPRNSTLHSKISSSSFDLNNTRANNYYANYHTLRYEDKFTNPISGAELSMSTFTTSSLEIDVHCPSHGKHAKNKRDTGFNPVSNSPFVAAFITNTNSCSRNYFDTEFSSKTNRNRLNTYLTKSRRSFLNHKYKKAFSVRRRRKSRANALFHSSSRRGPLTQKSL
ncbi:uncharacterized protein LOC133319076 [Danaus plexippus]|uniref:uncharacterized protein LOC133319076 n=1 Tax=Danaus plexippus TaxID=13037 RepID=UPI002AAF61A5|nr:uncharacterized protein LOC133319076 [Danaus plexippus]